jgi:primase-polymerase (primpol)-like protein
MITDISKILTVNPDGIPDFLKSKPYWINWKPVCADGKVKKLPTYGEAVLRGRYWDTSGRTFAEAFRTMSEQGGVSLLLSMENPLACIDIDDCNGDDPRLLKILQLVPNAWHELSPSGHGVHVWGVLPDKKSYLLPGRNQIGYHGSEYEWYGSGRAITVTGHQLKENRQTNPKNAAAVTENNFPGTKSPAGSFEAALPEYYFRGNCLPDLTPAVAFCESLRPKMKELAHRENSSAAF